MSRALTLLAFFMIAVPVFGQDQKPETKPEAKPAPTGEEIADEQARIRQRLEHIEATMKRVAKILASRNPEQAARLQMAFRKSRGEDENLSRLKEIENYLRSGYFEQALKSQKELDRAIERLLDILLDRQGDLKELEEEIKRLESIEQHLNKIIADEREQLHQTEKFANPEKTLRDAAAAKRKLEQLIARQQKMIGATKGESGRAGDGKDIEALKQRLEELQRDQKGARDLENPEKQEALAKRAEELAKDIAAMADKQAKKAAESGEASTPSKRAAKAGKQAADAVQRASQGMGEAASKMKAGANAGAEQKTAEQDLNEAREALERLARHARHQENKDLAKKQERIRKDTERLQRQLERLQKGAPESDSGSGDLGKAQDSMKGAQKGLESSDRGGALPKEKKAKEELERAYKKLEELEKELKRLIKLPDYDKMADEQEKTAKDTEKLQKKMKNEGGEGDPEGKGTPGEGQVQQAKKAMQRAKRNLRQKSAKGASSDQKEALERLEKAREELEEALRQLREEQQLMLLDALERRLGRMLQKQISISKETIALHLRVKQVKKPARADVSKSAQLGQGERELEAEADKILEILREEGTTIVIPDIVNDLMGDFSTLDLRLTKLQSGTYTQQIQRDVEETLRQLIKVIQEERERRQGGGQGGGQDGQEEAPDENLLPTSAELKMLREMQVRVNRRTKLFQKIVDHNKDKAETRAEERARIAKKQQSVGNLTRSMADKLNREEE